MAICEIEVSHAIIVDISRKSLKLRDDRLRQAYHPKIRAGLKIIQEIVLRRGG